MSEIDFPVVGVGLSAGGRVPLKEFFSNLPDDTKFKSTFLLALNLLPGHEDSLEDILEKITAKNIYQVQEKNIGIELEPDTIYLASSNDYLILRESRLYLEDPGEDESRKFPLDNFFFSLANSLGESAIGVLFSGDGTDGVKGIEAIKDKNGMVMVQAPETAEYDTLLREAINTKIVDYVLPPEKMPSRLISYIEHTFGPPQKSLSAYVEDSELLQEVFRLLQVYVGHDFSGYKVSTLKRRIYRRMAVRQVKNLKEYVELLKSDAEEVRALFKNVLVGVTNFFRDPKVFEKLKKIVIPGLFENKKAGDSIRVWIPGCSTGEEAYSIAILLREELEKYDQPFKVYIFATDIDEEAVEKARVGLYPVNIANDITSERLKKFFTYNFDKDAYQVTDEIREMIIFAEQNVIHDPPFTKLDLVCCRNLLIFLKPEIQKKVLHLFHYALNKDGYLLVGSSETANELTELFKNIDRENKIYQKVNKVNSPPFLPRGETMPLRDGRRPVKSCGKKEEKSELRSLTEKFLLRYHTPPGVVINEQGEILYIHGRTGKFLEPSQGKASMNIFQMARKGLKLELSEAVRKVAGNNKSVSYEGLKVQVNGEFVVVNLRVRPVAGYLHAEQELILVVFEEVPGFGVRETYQGEEAAASEIIAEKDRRIAELEGDLKDKEEKLQRMLEDLGTYKEELQSLNEEYQSTNEELETSKEELQSLNEELTGVNKELQEKIEELREANNDMNNMLAGTGIATIFLDEGKCIKRFTPPAKKIFNLIEGDMGRAISDITSNLIKYENLEYENLEADIQYVLDTLEKIEKEVQAKDSTWYLMRILPYRTVEKAVEGVVINFIDITELKGQKG